MTTIITTSGISLFLNTKRTKGISSPSEDEMRHFLREKPEIASAEVNSLHKIAEPGDSLVFLCTQTVAARLCALLLKEYFHNEKGFQNVRIVELEFQDDERHIETHGLRNLVNTIIDEIETAQRRQQDVIINATTGFKVESGYSTLIGLLYRVPVKYIHEQFKRVVTLNPISLEWNTSLLFANRKFIFWVDDKERSHVEVNQRLKAMPVSENERETIQAMLTEPDEEGNIYLSPLGNVLLRHLKLKVQEAEIADWPVEAQEKTPDKKIASSIAKDKHHFPKGTRNACQKIAQLPWVQNIIGGNFENTTFSRIKNWNIDGSINLIWADNEKAANITVLTTAQGTPQTLKIVEKIREILEID